MFFTFIKTYHQIALKLFVEKSEDFEIENMRKLFNELYLNTNSTNYMSDYFIMLMIFYYDKFGSEDLYHLHCVLIILLDNGESIITFLEKKQ